MIIRRLLAITALLAGSIIGAAAADGVEQRDNQTYSLKAGGMSMRVQACSDGIFRVRISQNGDFTESLMERYGIVKTDWEPVKTDVRTNRDRWMLATAGYSLSIDKKSGIIAVKDASGNIVIRNISYSGNASKLSNELREYANKKYEDLHVVENNGGIIGDDNGIFAKIDKREVPGAASVGTLSMSIEDGERFYGGGSTSRDHIQHRGEFLRMWTTYQHTEIPMPFMMSSSGWGVYDNLTSKSFFDVGCTSKSRFNILDLAEEADFYIFIGKDMPAILNEYTLLTGRSYVLPKWAYGLCFGPNMLEDQWNILRDAVMFRQADVPCDVFWLEPQWMEKRYDFSTEKNWNFDKFSPEPYWAHNEYPKKLHNRLFIGKLRSMGFHLGLWLCEDFDLSITEEDELALRDGRDTSGKGHWMTHLTRFMDQGVEGFKLDPARTIDNHPNMKYYNGRTDKEMHNLNQVLLPKQMRELGRKYNGKRTWHHYCGGWAGTQHWTASTSGDNGGGKTALYDQLNLGMSGFLNTSCDVMSVPRELEMQSLHFGLFLPWVQINSWFSMMQPFYYDKPEQNMYKYYVKLRYSLAPYIYSMALGATQNGMPIVRSMPLSFPDDRNCDDMTYQYMFGDSFCVGIFTDEIYLPAGTWFDAWSGEKIASKGETFNRVVPEGRAGLLFVRAGAIIPTLGGCFDSPAEGISYLGAKPFENLTLRIYPSGSTFYTLLDDDGESYEYEKGSLSSTLFECRQDGGKTTITLNPVQGSFNGMSQTRTYALEVQSDAKPSVVVVNGRNAENWNYSEGILRLPLGTVSVSDKLTIEIN
ncbi:MAG: glycoside hydrolase family 31 protein [Bacteroidales bacterium]|nr:glycoside hydrolase family 31 protein [Bacteroidales bacterium]MDY6000998.1 glycoside hydrolase family 31 protein [Candidatus Cryptobacteroides sp.]